MEAMTVGQLMDAIAVRLRAEDVGGIDVRVDFVFRDASEEHQVELSNRTLHDRPGRSSRVDATATLDRAVLIELASAELTAQEAVDAGRVEVDGDVAAFRAIFDHLDTFMSMFPIVEP
jgi:alkyl sulfatase BDS1-like metallo-beta-lactamase superfamily hydrolase